MTDELLKKIDEACKKGMSERAIKDMFLLTDWEYKQARKVLKIYGKDFERKM